MTRAILSVIPSPTEAALALLQVQPKFAGKSRGFWNGKHWEYEQPTRDDFRLIDCWTLRATDLVPRIEAALAHAKKVKIAGSTVTMSVIVDRNEVGDPLIQELWTACVRRGTAGCIALDVRTDVRSEKLIPRIVKLKGGDAGVSDAIAARDVSEALREMRRTARLAISPKAADYAVLLEEIDGFDGQQTRRRARAVALALWVGYCSPTGAISAGRKEPYETSEVEQRMLASALRKVDQDDEGD
jgi:hypothetical protein